VGEFYDEDILKLVPRLDKWLKVDGDYVEKIFFSCLCNLCFWL